MAGGRDDVQDVILHLVIEVDRGGRLLHVGKLARIEHGLDLAPQAIERDVHDLALLARAGIADDHLEHEAVNLGFGQRIGSLLLDRVLRGQDEKRLVERERLVADRDLMLLHRLQRAPTAPSTAPG